MSTTQQKDHDVVVELLKELKALKSEVAQLKKAKAEPTSSVSSKKAKPVPKTVAKLGTKAEKIRALWIAGWSRGDIANALGIRFQHVYNTTNRVTKSYNPDQVKRK